MASSPVSLLIAVSQVYRSEVWRRTSHSFFLSSSASSQSRPYDAQNSRQFVGVMSVKSMSAEQSDNAVQTCLFLTSAHPDGSQDTAPLVGATVGLGVGSEVVRVRSEVVGSEVVGSSAGAAVGAQ